LRAVMEIPGRSLAVQCSDEILNAAVDKLADALAAALRKYNDLAARHTFRQQRKERNFADLSNGMPMLLEDEKINRKESFFTLLRPRISFLENQARKELKVLELEGIISEHHLAPEELVDEVVVIAWEKFKQRPVDLSLEHWLIRLLYERLQAIEWEASLFVSLDDSFHLKEIDRKSEPDWMEEAMDYDEKLTLAELIPDDKPTEEWGFLTDTDQAVHIYSVLQNLPSYARQAYLLHSIEEYNIYDIAEIQGRSEKDVEDDIEVGKESMQSHMGDAGMIASPVPVH